MPRKCANGTCKKVAILKRPKTAAEPEVLPEESNYRRLYGQYAKESLEKAIKAVKEENMSCCKAAKEFSVPRSTLKNYLQERSKLGVKPGRRRSIPEDIENGLVDKAISAAQAGFPITKKEFLLRVEMTAKKLNLDTQFKSGVPGNDYWRAVKTRRPDLVSGIRKSDNSNINMKKSLKKDSVTKYFDDLEKLLTELDLFVKPACIWNGDELAIQYCAEPVKILTKRGTQDLASKSGINKETNNAVLCVSAMGQAMPPLFLVNKGEVRTMQKFSIQSSPTGSMWIVQEDPWSSDQILTEWFKEVFLKNCGPDRPQALLLDNHGSQEMLDLLEVSRKEKIYILSLPPRSSPWLEPLDRGIFMTFQKACRKFALQFMFENPTLVINHDTWPTILCQVWEEVMRADVITRAFEITGIYPFDRTKIPQHVLNSFMEESPTTVLQHNNNTAPQQTGSSLDTTQTTKQIPFGRFSSQQHHHHHHHHPQQNHNTNTAINPVVASELKPTVLTMATVPMRHEESVPTQVYTPVSNPSFMTSTDPSSMFPVFNT